MYVVHRPSGIFPNPLLTHICAWFAVTVAAALRSERSAGNVVHCLACELSADSDWVSFGDHDGV